MGLKHLGNKRARRSRTWVYVCAGLFSERSRDEADETN